MTKQQTKKLDIIWAKKVKENASFRCEVSGELDNTCMLNSHHYIGRRNKATRWYLPNGIALSVYVHKFGVQSAHENPEWFRKIMLDLRGKAWLNDIVKQSNKVFKGSYECVLEYLNGNSENYV